MHHLLTQHSQKHKLSSDLANFSVFKHYAPSITPNSRQSLMNLLNQTSLSPENTNIVLYCGNKSVLMTSNASPALQREESRAKPHFFFFLMMPFLWAQRLPEIRGPCLEAEPVSLLSLCLDRYHHLCHKSPLCAHGFSPSISFPNVFLDGSQHSLVRTALYFRADPPWVCVEKLLELYTWDPEQSPTFGSSSTIYCNPCTSTSLPWFYVASSKAGM